MEAGIMEGMSLIHLPGGLLLAIGIYVVLFGAVALAWAFLKTMDVFLEAINRDDEDRS